MNSNQIDFLTDLTYGLLLFAAIVFIAVGDRAAGIAFGVGVLVSYTIHVGWKMARFDPDWMAKEVTENLEESVAEEVSENVSEEVSKNVEETVTESVEETVTESVEETVTESVEETVAQEVSKNVEETVADTAGETMTGNARETVNAELDGIIAQLEDVSDRIDERDDEERGRLDSGKRC
ncbi:hypothetical protein BRC71_09840 [Halobacteriales archaeon QH_7_65_31]|nr:MAG: hypothetical protein BRC71_09840 [Halobacteriales archaeon QH_7_65_31]